MFFANMAVIPLLYFFCKDTLVMKIEFKHLPIVVEHLILL